MVVKMERLKKIGLSVALFGLLLVCVTIVPASAQPVTTYVVISDDQNQMMPKTPISWKANTILSKDSSNKVSCRHFSTSRTESGDDFPIGKIGVRAKVLHGSIVKFERNLINENSATAELNYNSGSESTSGTWTAETHHVFEAPQYNQYRYPVTDDTLSV
ncbi:hypothetical protein E2N92_01440 [Methanofollis formosanus]|uniref:Uncharacterized protein n=1 Tax=Methanofollis formosanus TaxID=299308 RepID=A0A8G0ZYD8_9EURY|nr:hypothetical protein [Methanofollis formosanus]QYZ78187.1 hypothetical protein E2N92_01440 [Methanofollis formosanus]